MDVWFDSGSSHAAVLEQRDNLESPADLYLEVTTSTEVGSSHHSLHPLLQEAEHLTRLFLLTV